MRWKLISFVTAISCPLFISLAVVWFDCISRYASRLIKGRGGRSIRPFSDVQVSAPQTLISPVPCGIGSDTRGLSGIPGPGSASLGFLGRSSDQSPPYLAAPHKNKDNEHNSAKRMKISMGDVHPRATMRRMSWFDWRKSKIVSKFPCTSNEIMEPQWGYYGPRWLAGLTTFISRAIIIIIDKRLCTAGILL